MQNNKKNKISPVVLLLVWLKGIWTIFKPSRILKRILIISFNVILVLFIIILALIYSPGFQTITARYFATYLSDYTGLEVNLDKFSIDIFHKIHLNNFLIKDDKKDTMIYLNELNIDILYSSIFHRKIIIDKIKLDNPKIILIRHKGDKYFNYEKLLDAFTSKDTTTSKDSASFDVKIKSVELSNATFVYKDEKYDTRTSEQMNYDYLKLTRLNLNIKNPMQNKNEVLAQITNFSAKEQSGFEVNHLSGYLKISPHTISIENLHLKTFRSRIKGNIHFHYPSFDDFIDDFENKVTITADLYPSTKIHFADLTHFAKELKGWDNFIQISGLARGKISDLNINPVSLNYAGTQINGSINMKGLPDIDKTLFNIQATSMVTNAKAIEQIPLYPFDKKEFVELPKQFENTGITTFKGNIKGYYHKMKIQGVLVTQIGTIKLNTLLTVDSITNDLNYKGNFNFINFHFGKFFTQKNIGTLNADVVLDGKGTIFKTMNTTIQAKINQFTFNKYTYQNIIIDANLDKKIFKGDLSSADTNAQLMFSGQINFNDRIPDMNFILSMEKLNLNRLNLLTDKRNGVLSGTADIKLSGQSIDDITGKIQLNNIQYATKDKVFYFANSKLDLNQKTNHNKTFLFRSNFFDIDINGKFQLSEISDYYNHFLSIYYPSFLKEKSDKNDHRQDTFSLSLKVKNFEPFSELLTNHQLFIQPNTQLNLRYNHQKTTLYGEFHSSFISYGQLQFVDNTLKINSTNANQLTSTLNIKKVVLSDSLYLDNVAVCSHSKDNYARTNIEWKTVRDSVPSTYNGQIGLSTVFYPHAIYIVPDAIEIPVDKDKWIATQLNPIIIDTTQNIDFFPVEITKGNQRVSIYGHLHNQKEDTLVVALDNFQLHQLNPILSNTSIDLRGILNGHLILHQSIKKPFISSRVTIDNLYLNNYFIGNLQTHTAYQPLNQSLYLRGNLSYDYSKVLGTETKLKYLHFEGIYYVNKKDSSLDIDIEAKPFNLSLLNPILKDIMTIDYAFLYGKGKIEGTPQKPLMSGNFQMTDSKIKTDYLNAYHKITGNIEVMPDQIRFDEMKVYNYGSKELAGFLNGNIFHNNFSNMRLDFDINAKNLLVLNTNPLINKDYYGKIFASGTIGIYGFINDMHIEANLTPKKNSRFILSFAHAEEVGENSFIKFINPNDTLLKKKKEDNTISGLQMNFIFNTTPDLETEVILNDKTGDGVKARGDGVIEMSINSFGKFEMNGEYTIQSGTYLFTLESIINKKFNIEPGSKITFVGNPYNSMININASYIQKASLAPLFPYDSSGTYKRRYPVKAQLDLTGKIISPNIGFTIDVLQSDPTTSSKIQLLLSDEHELNRQFFSLLLLKSFVPPLQYANAGGVSAGSALAANSSEMLSNKLNDALKGISKFVDIGVNYNPGSETSSQQMELTMSKQLFNNRLSIDGSFGVNNNQAQHTSQIIGDVMIEYKLTESGKYILRVFNRTNNNTQLTISGGPYTQGIGAGYKYEFNHLNLFRRKSKKEK